ncbi:MAG: GFA family protein [Alphaproteobacteria bacterium]|nr:GFA family protein [Alphaproteobacteria bacterium]
MTDGANNANNQSGSCLCGAVSFEFAGGPFPLTWCHCSMCRKFHGHAMPAIAVANDTIKWSDGAQDHIAWFVSSEKGRRGSCRRCGSALFYREEGEKHIAIVAGAIDDPTNFVVDDHIYAADKGDWYELPDDGLPHHEGDWPTPPTRPRP